jgi:HAD superfamily hydrolase (TIGR01490 family)
MNVPDVPTAFFDLDDTLTIKNSNSLWMDWRLKRDIRGIFELMVGLHNNYYYKRGILTGKKMNLYFYARTIGLNVNSYQKMSERFFNDYGKNHIYPEAFNLIKAHKDKNIHTVIITAQDNFLAYPFFKYLEADYLISNKRIISKNKIKGIENPNCYGEGKIILAEKYLSERNVHLKDCSFFSDSISDLPLFKKVKYPVAVNPDAELFKIAADLKWDMYNFNS